MSTTYILVESKSNISVVFIFETKLTCTKLIVYIGYAWSQLTHWLNPSQTSTWYVLLILTCSKLIVHRVCMSTTYQQVESESNINMVWIFEKKITCSKLIVQRVCMSTTYILVEPKSNINMVCIFGTKNNMLNTHSTRGMHEHNLQTGWIQVNVVCIFGKLMKIKSTLCRYMYIATYLDCLDCLSMSMFSSQHQGSLSFL